MKNGYFVFLNIILIIFVLITTQYRALTDNYHVNDDVRNIFFVNNFPDSLEDNLLAQYAYGKWVSATIYLSHFYIMIDKFVDFIFFTKVMSIFTFLLSVFFIYKLGKVIKNKKYALILTFLFILQPWTVHPFSGGLSKSFAFPLLIIFLYYLIKKDNLKLSLVLLLEAMLYPPIFLISLFTFGLSLIDLKRKRINLNLKRNRLFFISIIISFMLVLVPITLINYGIKDVVTFKEAVLSPEFYGGGNIPIFRGNIPFTSDIKSIIASLVTIYDTRISRPFHTNALFVLLMASLVFMIIYKEKIFKLPREIYLMFFSSLFLQSLAVLLLFRLYLPVRYIQYSFPLFLIIILAHGLYILSENKKTKPIFMVLALLLIIFYIPKTDPSLVYCGDKGIYDYLQTLPTEAMIAGYPTDMNCIALYGQRKPFIMGELNEPFFTDYYKVVKQRNLDFFSAYYSSSKEEILEFCKENRVSHIVVNKKHFDEKFLSKRRIYIEPFSSHIKGITKDKKDFYFVKPENILFESNDKLLVGCSS